MSHLPSILFCGCYVSAFQSQCGGGSQTLYGQGMTVHNWAQANMICAGRNATLPMRFDPREAASLQCFARLLQPVATALGRDLAVWASVSTTDTTSDFFAISGGRSDYRQNRMKSQDANVFQVLCETGKNGLTSMFCSIEPIGMELRRSRRPHDSLQ